MQIEAKMCIREKLYYIQDICVFSSVGVGIQVKDKLGL